jgi:hypothetical protein
MLRISGFDIEEEMARRLLFETLQLAVVHFVLAAFLEALNQ